MNEDIIQKRKEANLDILSILEEEFKKHPELRFHQLLEILDVTKLGVDKFYEESITTLEKLKKEVENYDKGK